MKEMQRGVLRGLAIAIPLGIFAACTMGISLLAFCILFPIIYTISRKEDANAFGRWSTREFLTTFVASVVFGGGVMFGLIHVLMISFFLLSHR